MKCELGGQPVYLGGERMLYRFKKQDIKIEILSFFLIIKETITENLITICNDLIFLKNPSHLPQHGLNLNLECSSESVILWKQLSKAMIYPLENSGSTLLPYQVPRKY